MKPFDPRESNRAYVTRAPHSPFSFVYVDAMDILAYQAERFQYLTEREGRFDHSVYARVNTANRGYYSLELDDVRLVDTPDDYYKDPRELL